MIVKRQTGGGSPVLRMDIIVDGYNLIGAEHGLSGALEHRDSMGNGRVIRAGEAQYMSAGLGVRHSEINPSKDEPVHLLQIWIQPDRQGVTPLQHARQRGQAEIARAIEAAGGR